jgi:hypothetical protein
LRELRKLDLEGDLRALGIEELVEAALASPNKDQ